MNQPYALNALENIVPSALLETLNNPVICELTDAPPPYLLLRGDVEYDPANCVEFASVLENRGMRCSFYFRTDTAFDAESIRRIADMGHECGLHHNAQCSGPSAGRLCPG